MATVTQCDRCGVIYFRNISIVPNEWVITHFRGMTGSAIDLCPECLNSLEKWLNAEAQKELKENMRGCENGTI